MAATKFPGFPVEGIEFLRALEQNNKREWFQPRKDTFDAQVKAPMVELVETLNRALTKFAPEFITDPAQAIYRIYRDTRFSPDKTPYKTHIAASFRRRGMDKHAMGGLYFGVSHKEFEVAGGVYMPGPEQILAIRNHIAQHPGEFEKILKSPKLQKLVGTLQGSELTRPPKGFPADHPSIDLIRKKQWYFYILLDPSIVTTSKVVDHIVDRFQEMLPAVQFLNAAFKVKRLRPEDLLM